MGQFTLICLAVLLVNLAVFTSAWTQCGSQPFRCERSDNTCTADGKCVCKGQQKGIGPLGCFNPNSKFCHLTNDPQGKGFSGKPNHPLDLPLPCQFLAADYTASKNAHTCNVKIESAGQRHEGKFYIHTFNAQFAFTSHVGQQNSYNFQLRGIGKVTYSGDYSFVLFRQNVGSSTWQWDRNSLDVSDLLNGNNVFEVTDDNRLHLSIPKCALELYFRPMDFSKTIHNILDLPGLVIGVVENGFQSITYHAESNAWCGSDNPNFVQTIKNNLGLNAEKASFYRAVISSKDRQVLPEIHPGPCSDFGHTANNCEGDSDFVDTINKCYPLFREESFVNCFSTQSYSGDLITLGEQCIRCNCKGDTAACTNGKASYNRCNGHLNVNPFP